MEFCLRSICLIENGNLYEMEYGIYFYAPSILSPNFQELSADSNTPVSHDLDLLKI